MLDAYTFSRRILAAIYPRVVPAVVALGTLLTGNAPAVTLRECEQAALMRAPAAHAALAAAEAAAANVRGARAAWWPTLAVRGDYGVSSGFDPAVTNGGQTDALLSLAAVILDGGARAARVRAAQADLRGAAARTAQQRADVVFAVRTAYIEALAAEAAGTVQDAQLARLREYDAAFARLEAAGLAPHTDVLRAGLAVTATEGARRAAAADDATARDALAILTGLAIADAQLATPDLRVAEPTTDAIDAAPVVADARGAADTARADIDVARSEWRSQFRLTADGGALGVRPGETFRHDGGGQFMLGFMRPLFDGGVVESHVAAASATAVAAEARVDQARQDVRLAIARVIEDGRRAEGDVAAGRRAERAAAAQAVLMHARYLGGGSVRLLEVLDAVAANADTRLAVSRAERAYRTAAATEAQVLGEAPR